MLSGYGKREWFIALLAGIVLLVIFSILGWWPLIIFDLLALFAVVWFFRDPQRRIPIQRGIAVAPSDGRVSSIHEIEHFEPFGEPAVCVRIFMSLTNVHVNRAPCHGQVTSITHKPGKHLNVLNPESAEVNEYVLTILHHPIRRFPVAAVRQVAGLIARTIVCDLEENQVIQRGQRIGMIKFGSTTELYLPKSAQPRIVVEQGQKVHGGNTILAQINPARTADAINENQ